MPNIGIRNARYGRYPVWPDTEWPASLLTRNGRFLEENTGTSSPFPLNHFFCSLDILDPLASLVSNLGFRNVGMFCASIIRVHTYIFFHLLS